MVQSKLKTKANIDFIVKIMSVFEKFEHQDKKYLSYLATERKGDEAVVYEKIIIPLFTDVLSYDKHKDFNPQASLSTGTIDNWIRNREGSPLIALEALRSNASQTEFIEHHRRLLSGYFDDLGAKYAVLTDGIIFEIWNRIVEKSKGLLIKIDFKESYTKFVEKGIEAFVDEDLGKFSNLMTLKKENQYLDVEHIYPEPQLDISEELHFNNFLSVLQEKMEEVEGDVLAKFEYLKGEYQECSGLIKQYKERTFLKIRKRYERAQKFIQSFETWQKTSPTNTTPGAFCLETMYVFFNRILLIRICEDKGIIPRKISNGGIKQYIEYKGYIKFSQVDYKALLKEAYQIMDRFYPHLFQTDIFDWYEIDNDILLRVLFTFNPYNFNKVDRDVLGKLYEKYLDREERKRLGEFYTPEEVIDYILDSVGYTGESEIEGKKLLDPACGSGGFLVRATNIFVEKLKNRGFDAETILRKLQESIYGFDINSFACHLAETNLFFQVIDIVHKAKENSPDFAMDRFNIYQTDSLRIPEEKEKLNLFPGGLTDYLIDAEIVKRIKLKQGEFKDGFDFVVGNPPYVTVWGIDSKTKKYLRERFETAKGRFNTFTIFLEKGILFLEQGKVLGFVVPQGLLTHEEYKFIRRFVLKTCQINHLTLLPYGTFESAVETLVIIIKREHNEDIRSRHRLTVSMSTDKGIKSYAIAQETFEHNPLQQFSIFITPKLEKVFEKIHRDSLSLGDLVEIQQGIIYSGRLKEEVFANSPVTSEYKPILDGRDIDRYIINWNLKKENRYLKYSKDLHRAREERLFLAKEKLLIPRKSTSIVAAYDNKQFYALNTTYLLLPTVKEYSLKYLLALLNSKLVKNIYRKKWVGWQIVIPALKELPIKPASVNIQQEFALLVDQILEINRTLPQYEAKVNDIRKLLEDFDFPFGDLADIPGIRTELRDRIGKPRIKREGFKVFLDSKSYIECKSEYIASYIEVYLQSLGDTLRGKTNSEVVNLVQIPQSSAQLKKVLQKRAELFNEIEKLKHRRDEIDEKIDERVNKLYGLTEQEIKIVEGTLKKDEI